MLNAADIEGYGLFSGLDRHELEGIAKMARRKEYPVNSIISRPESCATDLYLLEDGNESIQMEIPSRDDSSRIVIHTLSKGEVFCWTPLCPAHARIATTRVIKPATVVIIDGAGLKKLMDSSEHTGFVVMRNLACIISARLSYITMVFSHEISKLKNREKAAAAR